jgi:hypothetical protein
MNPASAAGLGVGVASLAFDAFDRSVKGQYTNSIYISDKCSLQVLLLHGRYAKRLRAMPATTHD